MTTSRAVLCWRSIEVGVSLVGQLTAAVVVHFDGEVGMVANTENYAAIRVPLLVDWKLHTVAE